MKIQLYSDIHIEQIGFFSIPKLDSDLIILAGDIDTGIYGLEWAQELTTLHKKPVIYVAGNHEYYRHEYHELTQSMREYADQYDYLHFLEKDELILNGVRFLGTTLWTNYFDEYGPSERDKNMKVLEAALMDHRVIRMDDRRFSAQDAYAEHLTSLAWLKEKLSEDFSGKTVVITHHAPSFLCNHKDFGMNEMSPGFVSNLEHLMNGVDLWCYGHTHSNLDIKVQGCRLVSNQKGYKREKTPVPFKPQLVISI